MIERVSGEPGMTSSNALHSLLDGHTLGSRLIFQLEYESIFFVHFQRLMIVLCGGATEIQSGG
ncbi:TPA: hypothetical protein ACK3RK_003826, partial [Burkholderia cepacia]